MLSGRDQSRLRLRDLGDLLLGKEQTGNVVLSLRTDVQLRGQGRARRPAGLRRGDRPADRRADRDVLEPELRPAAARRPQPQGGAGLLGRRSNPTTPRPVAAARVPGALPTGVHVQDRDHRGRARHRHRDADHAVPERAVDHAAAGRAADRELRRRQLRRDARGELRGLVQHDVRPARPRARRAVPAAPRRLRDLRGAAARPRRRARRSAAARPRARSTQNKPLFALAGIGQGEVATTPLQMALVAAAVANGGTIMRPHVAAEIRDDEGRVVSTIARRSRGSRRCRRPPRRRSGTSWSRSCERGHRHRRPRSPASPSPARPVPPRRATPALRTRGSCRSRRPRPRSTRWRCIVERGGSMGDEATGGRVAAPIAAAVLRFLLGR